MDAQHSGMFHWILNKTCDPFRKSAQQKRSRPYRKTMMDDGSPATPFVVVLYIIHHGSGKKRREKLYPFLELSVCRVYYSGSKSNMWKKEMRKDRLRSLVPHAEEETHSTAKREEDHADWHDDEGRFPFVRSSFSIFFGSFRRRRIRRWLFQVDGRRHRMRILSSVTIFLAVQDKGNSLARVSTVSHGDDSTGRYRLLMLLSYRSCRMVPGSGPASRVTQSDFLGWIERENWWKLTFSPLIPIWEDVTNQVQPL